MSDEIKKILAAMSETSDEYELWIDRLKMEIRANETVYRWEPYDKLLVLGLLNTAEGDSSWIDAYRNNSLDKSTLLNRIIAKHPQMMSIHIVVKDEVRATVV